MPRRRRTFVEEAARTANGRRRRRTDGEDGERAVRTASLWKRHADSISETVNVAGVSSMAFLDDLNNNVDLSESLRLEFKEARGGLPRDVWETYSAFANTEGGEIVLGVRETGHPKRFELVGVQNARSIMEEFWTTVRNAQRVERDVMMADNVRVYEASPDVSLVIIAVPRADRNDKPVRVFDRRQRTFVAYVRRGEDDFQASESDIRLMTYDNVPGADRRALDGFAIGSFCPETVRRYRGLFAALKPSSPWVSEPDEDFLVHVGALARGRNSSLNATQAGLLAFGYDYEITRYFPHYVVDYRQETSGKLRWDDRVVSSSADWSGNLIDFYLTVSDRIKRYFKMPFAANEAGMQHGTSNPVTEAVNEAVVNALAHAYYGSSGSIRVVLHEEGVEIVNPGSMLIDRDVAIAGGLSVARNPTLMTLFSFIGASDRAGSGLYSIWKIWESEFGCAPTIEELYSPVAVRLYMPLALRGERRGALEQRRFADDREVVAALLRRASGVTAAEVASAAKVSERTAQKRLRTLMDESAGRITRQRDGKSWRYYET